MKSTRGCSSTWYPSLMPVTLLPAPVACKVPWSAAGKGKRGGTHVIYYHVVSQAQIRMILIYRKGIKDDLTSREKLVLRKINAEW